MPRIMELSDAAARLRRGDCSAPRRRLMKSHARWEHCSPPCRGKGCHMPTSGQSRLPNRFPSLACVSSDGRTANLSNCSGQDDGIAVDVHGMQRRLPDSGRIVRAPAGYAAEPAGSQYSTVVAQHRSAERRSQGRCPTWPEALRCASGLDRRVARSRRVEPGDSLFRKGVTPPMTIALRFT